MPMRGWPGRAGGVEPWRRVRGRGAGRAGSVAWPAHTRLRWRMQACTAGNLPRPAFGVRARRPCRSFRRHFGRTSARRWPRCKRSPRGGPPRTSARRRPSWCPLPCPWDPRGRSGAYRRSRPVRSAGLVHSLGVLEVLLGARRAADDAGQCRPDPVLGVGTDLVAGGAALEHLFTGGDLVRILRQAGVVSKPANARAVSVL